MFYSLLFMALAIVIIEVYCAINNQSTYLLPTRSKSWDRVYRWRWLVGVPFAALSVFISYPIPSESGTYWVVGFPLAVAATDEAGNDYIGQFTTPFLLGNTIMWYFFPHIILSFWQWYRRKNPRYKV